MKEIDIKKLSEKDLKKLLKDLLLYQGLSHDLGKKWKEVFEHIMYGTHKHQVEYFDTVSEDIAWDHAKEVYKKVFDSEPERKEVEFLKKTSLKWGIKVYLDDKVVDMSFDKIWRALKG